MYSLRNDYSEGAHPNILQALIRHNEEQDEGYGLDLHSQNAVAIIRNLVGDTKADVHLLSGGTQTNLIAISSFLRPHEACIAVATGHIAVHEAGAIEATGHKLLTVDSADGKLTPGHIDPILAGHHFEHMVKPRLVYISNPTELGTVYSLRDLHQLHDYCQKQNLLLYCDGARLGTALVTKEAMLTLADMYKLTDAFFIGATKIGALFGEALILGNDCLKADFRYLIKQRGGLLAKGRVLGIQFEELFRDNLYFDLARHANTLAQKLAAELRREGCAFLIDSPTNQIFPVLADVVIEKLSHDFQFYNWAKIDATSSAIRLVTSWATSPKVIDSFIDAYSQARKNLLIPA